MIPVRSVTLGPRWLQERRAQLACAVVAMVFIAPLQYAWTLFTTPLSDANSWSLGQVQLAFTFFVVAQTASQPIGGYLLDRRGLALPFAAAAVLIAGGWGGLAVANSLFLLYVLYALAGIGAGLVYAGAIGAAIRWFPERRGMALGLVAAGFGAGAAPFIPLVGRVIASGGYRWAFAATGIATAVVVFAAGLVLRHPPHHAEAHDSPTDDGVARDVAHAHGAKPSALLAMGRFWFAFLAFLFMATGLLILTANTQPLAADLSLSSTVIIVAITLQQISNGASRVVWGWVSDKAGRRRTMAVAFCLNAVILTLIPVLGTIPVLFIVLTSLAFFTSGEIFALFPALTADMFGTRYAAANQGMLYTAKGIAALGGGALAAYLASAFSWTLVFACAGALAFVSAVMVIASGKNATSSRAVSAECGADV